jgi:hypothetical protein
MTQPYPPQQGAGGLEREATQQFPAAQGQPAPQYGPGPYGGPGAPAPKQRNLLPWLIAMGVLLLAALGVLTFLLFRGEEDAGTTNAADRSAAGQSAGQSAEPDDEGLGDVDGDAVVPPDYDGPEEQGDVIPEDDGTGFGYDNTADRATAFMDQVILGDHFAAISHGGQEFQLYYDGDTDLFAQEIAEATEGGTLYNYSIDSITWDPDNEADVVDVSIEMEEGWMDEFLVLVGAEGGNLVIVGFQ